MRSASAAIFLSSLILLSLVSCGGGGGGGGGFTGAAVVNVDASPSSFDTGDRTLVTINISAVHENGIILKIRYPDELSYVIESAFLSVDGDEQDVSPKFNLSDENKSYLVFFLGQDLFGSDGEKSGELTLELEASKSFSDDKIEVDADVDDPLINNDEEFSVKEPQFVAEDEASVDVVG